MVDVARLQIVVDASSADRASKTLARMNQEAAATDAVFRRLRQGRRQSPFGKIQTDVQGAIGTFKRLRTELETVQGALLEAGTAAELGVNAVKRLGTELVESASAAELLRGEIKNVGANVSSFDKLVSKLDEIAAVASGTVGRINAIERAASQGGAAVANLSNQSSTAAGVIKAFAQQLNSAQKEVSELSKISNKTQKQIGKLRNRVQTLEQRLNKLTQAARRPKKEFDDLTNSSRRLGGSLRITGNFLRQFATALGAVGVGFAFATGLRESIAALAGFEDNLAQVRAVAIDFNETLEVQGQQYEALANQARQLGAVTRFTASETAQAQLFLARAGFEVNEILSATPATLNLAAAGVLDLGEAADIASNVLQQFSLSTEQLTDVTDTLVSTANSSNTNVRQLASALAYAGPFAAGLGIQVEQASAAVGALGNAGIQATLAGTNLRGILVSLIKPSREAEGVLDRLGARIGGTSDAFNILENDLIDVFQALADSNASARELATIFSRRNVSGANALIGQLDAWRELESTIEGSAGTAQRAADIINDTLVGAFLRAKSAATELVLAIGRVNSDDGIAGAIRGFVETLAEALRLLAGFNDETTEFSTAARALALSIQAAAGALAGLVAAGTLTGLKFLITSLAAAAARATGLAVATTAAASAFAPFAAAGVVGAITAVTIALGSATDATDDLAIANQKLARVYDEEVFPSAQRALAATGRSVAAQADPSADATTKLQREIDALNTVTSLLDEVRIARTSQQFAPQQRTQGVPANRIPESILPELDQQAVREEARDQARVVLEVFNQTLNEAFAGRIRAEGRGLDPSDLFARDINRLNGATERLSEEFSGRAIVETLDREVRIVEAGVPAIFDKLFLPVEKLAREGKVEKSLVTLSRQLTQNQVADSYLKLADDLGAAVQEFGVSASDAQRVTNIFADEITRRLESTSEDAGSLFTFPSLSKAAEEALNEALSIQGATNLRGITDNFVNLFDEAFDERAVFASLEQRVINAISGLVTNVGRLDLQDLPDAVLVSYATAERVLEAGQGSLRKSVAELREISTAELRRAERRAAEEALRARGKEQLDALREELNLTSRLSGLRAKDAEVVRQYTEAFKTAFTAAPANVAGAGFFAGATVAIRDYIDANVEAQQEIERQEKVGTDLIASQQRNIEALRQEIEEKKIATDATKELSNAEIAELRALALSAQFSALSKDRRNELTDAIEEQIFTTLQLEDAVKRLEAAEAQNAAGDKLVQNVLRQVTALQEKNSLLAIELGRSDELSIAEQAVNIQKAAGIDLTITQIKLLQEYLTLLRDQEEQYGGLSEAQKRQLQIERAAAQVNADFARTVSQIITDVNSAEEALKRFIEQLIQLVLQNQILGLLGSGLEGTLLGGLLAPPATSKGATFTPNRNEKGNIFMPNVRQFRSGGIPTLNDLPRVGSKFSLFQTPNGQLNSLREGGQPEAILPLGRDSQGRLGVRIAGGSDGRGNTNNVTEITNFNVQTDDDSFALNPRQARRMVERRGRRGAR